VHTTAVVPLPVSVAASDAPPFRLERAITVTGDPAAARDLGAVLATLGLSAAPAADERPTAGIHLSIAPGGEAESYDLTSSAAGITIVGADAAGLFYGVQTAAQLLARARKDGTVPALTIHDRPRFAYRGVMLDVARHFHDVETVLAYIDRAAALKFNVLHLHLTDDQGWRLQSVTRPLLTERASGTSAGGDPGGSYTHDDYRRILDHASARHMTVVPEIDLPGHTHAVSLAHPELSEQPVVSADVLETIEQFGGGVPENGAPYTGIAVGFSSLRIHDEATYAFLGDVLGELAELTPGPYLHIGGDEALGTPADDYALFLSRVTAMVAALGKTPIAWHEAGAATGLHPSTVGQYWGFVSPTDGMDDKTRTFVRNGARVILSPADAVYLDMKFDAASPLGLTWARGVTSLQRSYDWEPAEVIDGVSETDILGVEAPLWTETVRDLEAIDALAFPRIAAAAEAAWSPPRGSSPERTWESFRTRVGTLGPLWKAQGIRFTALPDVDWS
jgi:hexosaminidase